MRLQVLVRGTDGFSLVRHAPALLCRSRRSYWGASLPAGCGRFRDPDADVTCGAARELQAGGGLCDPIEERPVLVSADVAGVVIVWLFVDEREVSNGLRCLQTVCMN